jgi:hypothetical protein
VNITLFSLWIILIFPNFLSAQCETKGAFFQTKDFLVQTRNNITIPIVIHVLYRRESDSLTDLNIHSQITRLNLDFSGINVDKNYPKNSIQKNIGIPNFIFCLDTIIRKKTEIKNIGLKRGPNDIRIVKNSDFGGSDPIDGLQKLNVWVCEMADAEELIFGQADLPESELQGKSYEGVTVDYRSFGSIQFPPNHFSKKNLGRILVHEIGHYFGLMHPWGRNSTPCGAVAQDDGIADTPPQNKPSLHCESFIGEDICKRENENILPNFMDYLDDECMIGFTPNQVSLMQSVLSNQRKELGVLPCRKWRAVQNHIKIISNPGNQSIQFVLPDASPSIFKVRIFDILGRFVYEQEFNSGEARALLTNRLTPGLYLLEIIQGDNHETFKIEVF